MVVQGLASTPVIDYRTHMDAREGDIHMLVHQFSTRQRWRLQMVMQIIM